MINTLPAFLPALALALALPLAPAVAQSAPGGNDAVPEDSCPVLFHWWVTNAPEAGPERDRLNSLIGSLGALPDYNPPEPAACAGMLQTIAFEGFDLGDPTLHAVQGLAPSCEAVLPYVQTRAGSLPEALRARVDGVMDMVQLPMEGSSSDPLACAILHATLVRGDMITLMGAP
ncbi:hypothetical protein [Pararhodobacter sp. CCB-MM2]|uniref:hypothetical protein n=1 Tax=Pararhodobacter sp. CCB-MM2 TaxID=1786003 RepID=UPI00082CB667|nr:hypothetical protein [Pararhodobacter sp. CCB-MM2]